jgi:hypothetical protein
MFDTLKVKVSDNASRMTMVLMGVAALVGSAGAAMNMTASFQPIIDMIGVITTNTDTWVALVVLSVILTMCVAVGHFVKGILSKSVGTGK